MQAQARAAPHRATGQWTLGLDATLQWVENPGFAAGTSTFAPFIGTSLGWHY